MVLINKIKDFKNFNKDQFKFIIITFIFSILMGLLGYQSHLKIAKVLYVCSAILFLCSSLYTLVYTIKKYKN